MPELVIPYAVPTNWRDIAAKGDFTIEPTASMGMTRRVDLDAQTPREKDWAAINKIWDKQMSPTPEWALVRLLKEMGLSKGRIAVDDWRIAHTLEQLGFNTVTCVPGDNTLRRIRMIKSEVELGFMKLAARANQDAAMEMLKQLGPGATKADIDQIFMIEAAKRGAKSTWIAAGTPAGMVEPELKPGHSMLIDAVSQINYYHGDFGRTYVLGEPSDALKKRTAMMEGRLARSLRRAEARHEVFRHQQGRPRGHEENRLIGLARQLRSSFCWPATHRPSLCRWSALCRRPRHRAGRKHDHHGRFPKSIAGLRQRPF